MPPTPGPDILIGNNLANTINGLGGDDLISGLGGNDTLEGDADNDTVLGGNGDDSLLGGAGADLIDGGDGNDILDGGTGADALLGGAGLDTIKGDTEGDFIDGGEGNDSLLGLGGNDIIYGDYGGAESLAGNDILHGGAGNDFLDGGAGVDRIIGGVGVDVLFGGEDAETQTARDTLTGGADTDYFQLLYTGFIPEPPVVGEPIIPAPVGDYVVDFVKGSDFFLVPGITFEQLGFQNISLTVGGVASPSTRIYVKPEVGIPIAQAETLAVVQGVRGFNTTHFIFGAI